MNSKKVFNYSYYENLGFKNFESWSEGDLSQFLILDLLNGLSNTTAEKDMPETFANLYKLFAERSQKYQNIFRFVDWIFPRFVSFFEDNKNREKILFVNSYAFIIPAAKKHYSLKFIARGKRDRLFAVRNFMGYIDTSDLVQYVFLYLKERKIEHLHKLMKRVEAKLKIIKPNYIMLSSNSLPIERAIILASKKLGITTMEIQIGINAQSSSLSQAADYVLVWGEYFKGLYVKLKIRSPEDIYILGYQHQIEKDNEAKKENNHYTICCLAQDFEVYNKSFLLIKLETIEKLSLICKKLNFKFICRPHPGDNRKLLMKKLPYISFTPEKEKLEQTFKGADVLISFSSTALVEAAMRSKICLQLMNYPIESDNYERLGICSKSFETFTELEDYLKKISDSPNLDKFRIKFNNRYIETRYDPGQRFLEILEEIKNKNH